MAADAQHLWLMELMESFVSSVTSTKDSRDGDNAEYLNHALTPYDPNDGEEEVKFTFTGSQRKEFSRLISLACSKEGPTSLIYAGSDNWSIWPRGIFSYWSPGSGVVWGTSAARHPFG